MTTGGGENFIVHMQKALDALRARDPGAALEFLAQAEKFDPKNPDVFYNRAAAKLQLGDRASARAALDAALALQPYYLPAMLSKGALLEGDGRFKEAAVVFRNAIAFAPDPSHMPSSLAKSYEHAVAAVNADNIRMRDFMLDQLSEIQVKYGKGETKRFDECLQIFTGFGRAHYSKPTMLYFPALPQVSYFDRSLFPWIENFEAATADIQREFNEILASPAAEEFSPYINYPPGAPVNQWGELNKSDRWSTYFFWKDGTKNEGAYQRAPRTGAAIDNTPLFDAPMYGPAAFFSSLAGRSHIPPHVGSSNVRSIVHLPLELPGPAWFRVGNERREWKIGEAFVFDDTVEHEAKNEAETTRTILIVDIWNPYLTAAERELVSVLLPSIPQYRRNGR